MKVSFFPWWSVAVVGVALSALLVACGVPTQADEPAPVHIDEVTVQILESFPVQVAVSIRGSLPDSCTEMERVNQRFEREEKVFWIEMETVRTGDVCAQALVPFEERVQLEVYGLPAGTYTVNVHGVKESFTLDVDNAPSDAGLPNPAAAHCEEQGYRLELRTDEHGNQYGVCIFPGGSECDEWVFYRGECGPTD